MRPLEPAGSATPRPALSSRETGVDAPWIIETEVSPFHCLYQDALFFHSQSRLIRGRSESESSRLARAALLAYVASAEALVHQAAIELGRPELAALAADPRRPLPLDEVWRLLPAIAAEASATANAAGGGVSAGAGIWEHPPWPQFAELLALRTSWIYPGNAASRRAYYRAPTQTADYEPLQSHQAPADLRVATDRLNFPRTGLPRDPYALRPEHLDTARSVLDSAIGALDRRLGGALTRDNRHRREPVRFIQPPDGRKSP